MNRNQNASIRMFLLVGLFFTKYLSVLKLYIPLFDEITAFIAKQKELNINLSKQSLGIAGVKDSKEIRKQNMIDLILPLASLGAAWAKKEGESVLLALFEVVDSNFLGSEQDAVVLANNIVAALSLKLTKMVLYEITQAQLDAATAAIVLFGEAVGTPEQQKQLVQTATIDIEINIKEMEEILLMSDKLMIGRYSDIKDMLNEYQLSRKVGRSVGQHTAVKVFVYADLAHTMPINEASISIGSIEREEFTDIHGEGEIVQFNGGNYSLAVKADGFVNSTVDFSIKRGKHVDITVVLEAKVLVVMATKKGLPVKDYSASVVDTLVQGMTNAEGKAELGKAPNTGVLEVSNENGEFVSIAYDMKGLDRLVMNVEIG